MSQPERVLLTGAAGIVATALRPLLRERYEEVVLTDLVPIEDCVNGESFAAGNLEDLDFLTDLADNVDGIIHLGGVVGADFTFEQTLSANIVGTHNVFEAAVRAGVESIVYASSHHAVGFTPRTSSPIDHHAIARPDGEYGLSKAYGEAAAAYYVDNFARRILTIRIGFVGEEVITERRLHTWSSPRDLEQLIYIGLTHPDLHHEIVYGASETEEPFFDNSNAFRLGYRPQDRAIDHVKEKEILTEKPDLTTISGGVIGGGFAEVGFEGRAKDVLSRP